MKDKRWVKIADTLEAIQFAANNIAEVYAGEKIICISKHNDLLFAFSHKCPHASGFLAEGYIDALGNVVCPIHRYKFCLKNGHNISGEGYYLKNWTVEIKNDGIFVGLDSNNLWGLL